MNVVHEGSRQVEGLGTQVRLVRVTRAVTLTTESRGRPVAAAGTKTLPGIVASLVFEVITAATVVLRGLALKGSDWITRTGRRFGGLLRK